jgi:hypothetical protein
MLVAGLAAAATVVAYSNDFDAYSTNSFSGTDGWLSGYASDAWSTYTGDGVYALTDDATGRCTNGSWRWPRGCLRGGP